MKQKSHLHNIFQGALILTASNLIAKILSAGYRIPLQNLVGNTGFYVYQQVYPLYGIGVTLALSGLPVFISKLVAEQNSQLEKELLVRQLLKILGVLALILVIGGWLSAPLIAEMMGDRMLTSVIRSVVLMFCVMPILAVGRGYWQGKYNMVPTATSQLVEQVVRVTIVISAAVVAHQLHWDVYKMGSAAMISAIIAGVFASFILGPSLWQIISRPHNTQLTRSPILPLIKRLVVEGGIVCLFAALIVLFQLIDSFTVKRGLVGSGLSATHAKALKGVFDRGQPLVQLGLVIATSFSTMLLPALTASHVAGKLVEFRRSFRFALHMCITMSLFAAGGLIVLMPQINLLLFASRAGSLALAVSMLNIVLVAVITTYSGALQSLNQFSVTAVGLIGGLGVKAVLNFYLVKHFEIVGAAVGTVLGLLVTVLIIRSAFPTQLRRLTSDWSFRLKLVGICAIMMVAVKVTCIISMQIFGVTRMAMLPTVFLSVLVGCLVALGTVFWWHLFSLKELVTFPGGKRLLILMRQLKK